MATLKHINSKNADYGAAEQYLLFEHDEFTMKPVLDETGRLIPREDYRLSTLNCGGEDFAVACMRANLRYGKNQRREDVKSHHYIISFDRFIADTKQRFIQKRDNSIRRRLAEAKAQARAEKPHPKRKQPDRERS